MENTFFHFCTPTNKKNEFLFSFIIFFVWSIHNEIFSFKNIEFVEELKLLKYTIAHFLCVPVHFYLRNVIQKIQYIPLFSLPWNFSFAFTSRAQTHFLHILHVHNFKCTKSAFGSIFCNFTTSLFSFSLFFVVFSIFL